MGFITHKVGRTKNIPREDLKGWSSGGEWIVIETETIEGERTSAYDSEPDKVIVNYPFSGSLADCNAWVQLREKSQIKFD